MEIGDLLKMNPKWWFCTSVSLYRKLTIGNSLQICQGLHDSSKNRLHHDFLPIQIDGCINNISNQWESHGFVNEISRKTTNQSSQPTCLICPASDCVCPVVLDSEMQKFKTGLLEDFNSGIQN